MKKTEEVEVPAKTQTFVTYGCDVCGTDMAKRYVCCMCEKDLCRKCMIYNPEDTGDYPDVLCKECWDLGDEFRKERDRLEQKIDEAYAKWHERCKEN